MTMPSRPAARAPGRYAVIGHPVAHSQSPFIHAAFAEQTGEAVDYGKLDCGADGFEAAVRGFAAQGGAGCNVTVPFKFQALGLGSRLSRRAQQAGVANLLRFDADGWLADNTDGVGLLRDIEHNAQQPLAGRRVLLVGAGGAAAGVLGPLLQARPQQLVLVNRRRERAQALADRHAEEAGLADVELTVADIERPGQGFDVVINATSSSLLAAAVPVPSQVLKAGTLALDMMYGAAAQGFLDWARRGGANGRDGLGMLVEQAAEAFFVWRSVRPDSAPVLQTLRERLSSPA
jgi:shikimate dehydrogenase